MLTWMRQLDKLLRGDATQLDSLKTGKIEFPAKGVLISAIILAASYGLCMGLFTVIRTGGTTDGWMQMLASFVKLPLLFILTLVVTLPSLYVFNALVGSRLTLLSVVHLLIASMAVTVAVLASLGPIIAFFSLSTTSHPFMVLLNVIAATIAGILGTKFLFHTLNRLVFSREQKSLPAPDLVPPPLPDAHGNFPVEVPKKLSALDAGELAHSADARSVFRIWAIVFALVGAQMSWVLRPFVGSPHLEFAWFRAKEDNFFIAIFEVLKSVFGGG
ncbi:MAG: hypothetical protein ABL962_14445 [Fimbriimonadaceae bacterium]